MVGLSTNQWDTLEQWSAAAFILAGATQLIHATLHILRMGANVSSPEWVRDVALLFVAVLLGLLGLVPRVAERMPKLARAGSVVVVLGAIGIIAIVLGEYVIGGGPEPPAYLIPLQLFYIIGIPLSFLLFGIASLRTRVPSRSVGVLLLVVFVSLLFFFHLIPLPVEGILQQGPSVVIAIAALAIGYLLQTETPRTDRGEPTADTTP